jgi:hypothetical protein
MGTRVKKDRRKANARARNPTWPRFYAEDWTWRDEPYDLNGVIIDSDESYPRCGVTDRGVEFIQTADSKHHWLERAVGVDFGGPDVSVTSVAFCSPIRTRPCGCSGPACVCPRTIDVHGERVLPASLPPPA